MNRNGNEFNIARMLFRSDCTRKSSDVSALNTYFGRDIVKATIDVFKKRATKIIRFEAYSYIHIRDFDERAAQSSDVGRVFRICDGLEYEYLNCALKRNLSVKKKCDFFVNPY